MLKRVATEVLPCLTAADTNVAAEIQQWLERARVDYRLHGDVGQRELALLRIDDNRLQQWRCRDTLIGEEARLRQRARG